MLTEIQIRNFALIDRVDLRFQPGLNVLTGETGAGKSIVIDAIGTILGERAGADLIRTGAERASIQASFSLDAPEGVDVEGSGTESGSLAVEMAEEGQLLISRELVRNGRASIRVNGRPATLGTVREVSASLLDLHGQHEHQSLLDPKTHRQVLDSLAGKEALSLVQTVGRLYREAESLRSERRRLRMDERQRSRQVDLLRFQVSEIDAAHVSPGEEDTLQADRTRLGGAEKLAAALEETVALLAGGEAAVEDVLGSAASRLRGVLPLDAALAPSSEALEGALIQIQEAVHDLRAYQESVEFNPERLSQIEERLDLLKGLKRKYGDSLEEVLEFRERAAQELGELESSEERTAELDAVLEKADANLRAACASLTNVREACVSGLEQAVQCELSDLGMEKTRFQVSIQPSQPGETGADDIEFLLSPNPGEPVKPLARIASGGEISRIMLALKSVALSGYRNSAPHVPTMIFDEIDVGIGGRTATVLARKLRLLGRRAQVICVSHLPQVAAAADHHLSISKESEAERTRVTVREVSGEPRTEEIARMLGGIDSRAATEHARQMLAALQVPEAQDQGAL
ncbi:MAG TPA: DNA repair protein RecN, partial [Armatimonadota bacterium]